MKNTSFNTIQCGIVTVLQVEESAEDFLERTEKKMLNQFQETSERLMYTAQEGSLLDRIWKGENVTAAVK